KVLTARLESSPAAPPRSALDQWFAVGTRWEGVGTRWEGKAGDTKPTPSPEWALWFTIRSREGNRFKGRLVSEGRADLAIAGILGDDASSFRWINTRQTANVWYPENPAFETLTGEGKCTAESIHVDWTTTRPDGKVSEVHCEFAVRRDGPRKEE